MQVPCWLMSPQSDIPGCFVPDGMDLLKVGASLMPWIIRNITVALFHSFPMQKLLSECIQKQYGKKRIIHVLNFLNMCIAAILKRWLMRWFTGITWIMEVKCTSISLMTVWKFILQVECLMVPIFKIEIFAEFHHAEEIRCWQISLTVWDIWNGLAAASERYWMVMKMLSIFKPGKNQNFTRITPCFL